MIVLVMNKMFVFLIIPIVVFGQELSSHLPIISINTNNQNILDSPRIICDMGVINNPLGVNNSTDVHNDYSGKINIEIRGSSSQMYPKKSYGFETSISFEEGVKDTIRWFRENRDIIDRRHNAFKK